MAPVNVWTRIYLRKQTFSRGYLVDQNLSLEPNIVPWISCGPNLSSETNNLFCGYLWIKFVIGGKHCSVDILWTRVCHQRQTLFREYLVDQILLFESNIFCGYLVDQICYQKQTLFRGYLVDQNLSSETYIDPMDFRNS